MTFPYPFVNKMSLTLEWTMDENKFGLEDTLPKRRTMKTDLDPG